ncbi:MAG: phosphatidylglycerol lysyltransferase domain-containing protein [Mycobacteriaceae bacterium]
MLAPVARWVPDGERTVAVVTLVARLTGLAAVLSVLLPVGRARARLGDSVTDWLGLPEKVTAVAITTTLVTGAALLLLASGLRRRKRNAWWASTALTSVLLVSHVLHPREFLALFASLALLAALLGTRRRFRARPDPGGRSAAVRVGVQLLVLGFLGNLVALLVGGRQQLDHPSLGERVQQAGLALVGVAGPVRFRGDFLDDLVAGIGLGFGLATLGAVLYFLLRTQEPPGALTPAEEGGVRELLSRGATSGSDASSDSLGYFALRGDKSVVFSSSGKSALTYRPLAGVALASGDPLGDPEAWGGAMEVFLARCADNGWTPAVLGCSEAGARTWARHGLRALEVGDEAVLDTASFTLQGRSMRGVRQAVGRLERAGYRVRVRRVADIDEPERARLVALAHLWRGTEPERGFSMALGRIGVDPACVLATAEQVGEPGTAALEDGAAPEPVVRGLLHFVPWGADGLSLDAMLRDRDSDNGVNELLITGVVQAAAELGVHRVSLNFAVFRAALERGERIGAGPVARIWAAVLRWGSRWWQIESLYRFNDKFAPRWVPRYLAYPSGRDLPRIGLAVMEAEGFGGRPPVLLRLLRR